MTIATYLAELERVAPPTASRASKPKRAPSGSSAPVRLSPPASPPRPRRRQCTAPSLAAAAFVAYAGQLGLRTLVTPLPLDWRLTVVEVDVTLGEAARAKPRSDWIT